MLINRLMHRWVLMEGEGSGDAPAGGAPAAAPATPAPTPSADGAAATPAPADGTPSGDKPAGVDLEALKPPASLVGEAKEGEKPADGDKPSDKPADAPDDKPVEYTDFTMPEGFQIEAEALAAFKEAAAGAKLSQDQAQAFVDMHARAVTEAATKPYELWRDTQKQWQDEIKADPEFGGAKLEKETIPSIARAIKAFSPNAEAEAALRQAFHFTGAGNHPEMIRFIARIGKSLAEGTHVGGKPAGNDGKSAAAKLYPSTQGGDA